MATTWRSCSAVARRKSCWRTPAHWWPPSRSSHRRPAASACCGGVRLAAGQDHVELLNTVVKARAPFRESIDKTSKTHREVAKESIQFAFPLAVVDARMTVDLSFAQMDPRKDQLPGANHNWITVGRWVDVSGPQGGVTWVTLDAPLIEIGGITADLINSQTDPEAWLKQLKPGHLFYSWVMNNHWGTNYRAWQEGPLTFRYALRPHADALDCADASRFAIGLSQALLAMAASTQPLPPAAAHRAHRSTGAGDQAQRRRQGVDRASVRRVEGGEKGHLALA